MVFKNLSRNGKVNLKIKQTNSYIWNSKLLHIGNFNSGDIIHCATTFRLTENCIL